MLLSTEIKSSLKKIESTLKSLNYEEKKIEETINFLSEKIKNDDLPLEVAMKKYNLENLLIKAIDIL